MRYQNARCVRLLLPVLVSVLGFIPASAWAQDTFKIAYIDPLSGGGASIGEVHSRRPSLGFTEDGLDGNRHDIHSCH